MRPRTRGTDGNHESPRTHGMRPRGDACGQPGRRSHGRTRRSARGTVESGRNERVGTDSVHQPGTAASFDDCSYGRANGGVCAATPRLLEGARDGPLNHARRHGRPPGSRSTPAAHVFASETDRRHLRRSAVLPGPCRALHRSGLQPPTGRITSMNRGLSRRSRQATFIWCSDVRWGGSRDQLPSPAAGRMEPTTGF